MNKIITALISLIALLHVYIAWFEMFAWESRGPKVFASFPADLFAQTTAMAANQGLYNAFLAVGLIWSLLISDKNWRAHVATMFLLFVAVAGIFGAATVSPSIFVVQTIPAAIALALIFINKKRSSV
ncbi:MAG: DUF1304 domain-containing protein [Paracoccaceae bacterium]